MKNNIKIKYFLFVSLIFVFLLANDILAIRSLRDERPPEVPPGVEPKEVEVLEEAKEVIEKETKLTIERIHPKEVKLGETIEITLKIANLGKEKVEFFVTEIHRPGLEYPDPIEIKKFIYEGLEIPYYSWQLSLEAGKEIENKYRVIPQKLGMILFPPAIINDQYGNNFESIPTTLEITCNPNGKCDPGENYIFCSEDCPLGSSDGICDGAEDGKCDPDCEKEADPDCEKIKEKGISNLYIIIGVIIVIIIVGAILIPRFLKKKE